MTFQKIKIKQLSSGFETVGKSIITDGVGNFNIDYNQIQKSNTIPTTPTNGDLFYYNTDDNIYKYDSTRIKWLSFKSITLSLGRNSIANNISAYLGANGVTHSSITGFIMPKDGTIISISIDNSNEMTNNRTCEVRVNNSNNKAVIDIIAGHKFNYKTDYNIDFIAGDKIQGIILPNGFDDLLNVTLVIQVAYRPI